MGDVAHMGDAGGAGPRPVRVDDIVAEVLKLVGDRGVASVYRDRILTLRTRRFEIGAGSPSAEVHHTLLGVELKIGRRRLLCPDLATARYLQVFARLGVSEVAVPYDITGVSRAADELESAWHRTILLADHLAATRSDRMRGLVRSRLVARERAEIERLGSGPLRPTFAQSTKQRRGPLG